MKKIRLSNQHDNERNYLDLVHLCNINDAVPEELDIPPIRLRPKSIYHPFDYNKDIKQIFGEI